MVLFKSCPKCITGDLLKSEDMFGAYLECVQCGFVKDLAAGMPGLVQVSGTSSPSEPDLPSRSA